ncbi:hypothetical protein HYC85_015082 [Camellia sinensis]|uniref:pectinesterase n=1 Tax=Camellia sinensis TaxID=4442 RepID=A0A7J7H961_CAMSI|nr:hypothetical protein HYC85_015082 [Camellia sinensis]
MTGSMDGGLRSTVTANWIDYIDKTKNTLMKFRCREKVFVPNSKPYISLIGDENRTPETIATWNDKASDKDKNECQLGTSRSALVTIESDFFCTTIITFENSGVAIPRAYGMQDVALRLAADKAMLYKVRVLETQDTLLDDYGSHYLYQYYIQGFVDFIFGRSRSLCQDYVHSTAERFGAIAAHHRDANMIIPGSLLKCEHSYFRKESQKEIEIERKGEKEKSNYLSQVKNLVFFASPADGNLALAARRTSTN